MTLTLLNSVSEKHIDQIMMIYRSAWWSADRTCDEVRSMLAQSDVAIGICENSSGRLIAFTRALTDYTYKALIYDVIVLPEFRGQGIGAMLMEAINRSMGPIGGQDLSRDALVLMVKKSDKSRLKTLLVHPAQDLSRSLRRASRVLFYDRCAPCLYTANILLLQDNLL